MREWIGLAVDMPTRPALATEGSEQDTDDANE